jgi:S-(hydroxymethyl)glutathione dehydrogenase/alcohol dehydrogenase
MRTTAAVLWKAREPWKVQEIELDPPREREVLVELRASGLCHSDDHLVTGDTPGGLPMVGGHEGAGVVVEVGSRVTRAKVGDHVILTPVPQCGECRWCATGRPNLCDVGAFALAAHGPDGTHVRHVGDRGIGAYCQLGTFAHHLIANEIQVVSIRRDVPFEVAALVGCGVTTGLGAAQRVAGVQPGDVVVVIGTGGVGINAVQGAVLAGATTVVAVDPVRKKRDWALEFGATHAVATMAEAHGVVAELTDNVMADKAILCVGVAHGEMIGPMLDLVSKGGRAVITSVAPAHEDGMSGSLLMLGMMNKQLVGHIYGEAVARDDFPRTLGLYKQGRLKLDEVVTARYALEDINEGFAAMHRGDNLRGVIIHDA